MYGIGTLLRKNARYFPERIAVADVTGEYTYAQLNDNVNRIANFMLYLGLEKGDRVGFICENCKEFALMYLAVQKAGLVAVLLNYRATREELSRDVRRARCKALFYAPQWKDIISRQNITSSEVRFLFSFGNNLCDGHISLDYIYTVARNIEPPVVIDETDLSTILFTSGSMGLSKGVLRTHRMIMAYTMQMAAEHEFYKTEEVSILSHSPLFHTGGLSMLMKALALSGTYIGVNSINDTVYAELIEKYKVSQLFLVPPVNIMRLSGSEALEKADTSSVNFIWATGGKLSVEYVQEMLKLFPGVRIKTSYGGTEFCAACSISFNMELEDVPANANLLESAGSIGQFVDVRLVDENGNDVPFGESGEVWVSSPFVMQGYMDDPVGTAEVLTNGWYHTGDVFRIDENGMFYFLDRISAMIKTGGENVYPNEVESVLRRHKDIVDCAVIGLPDAKWEEAVAAALVPGENGLDIKDVIAFAKENLAGYRKPLYYLILDDLPRTASAKIDRRALKNSEKYHFISIKELE